MRDMREIYEIARELGILEGEALRVPEKIQEGITLGKIEAWQDAIVAVLIEKFDVVSAHIFKKIRNTRNTDILKGVHRQAVKCGDIREFESVLDRATLQ